MGAADVAVLDAPLHDDLMFGNTNGHADDKRTYLEKFRAGAMRYFDMVHRIKTVRVFGDTALVTPT